MERCIYTALAAVFGLMIGSFLNVCVYRIPKGESAAKGRSYCPSCRHTLAFFDLVPVLSWVFLRGKCRYCKAKISPRYAAVELLTAACYAAAFVFSAGYYSAVLNCMLASVLIVLALIDWDTREIYDTLPVLILVLAALNLFLSGGEIRFSFDREFILKVAGFFAASLPMLAIACFTGGFGGGDIKLMAAAGLYLGAPNIALAFFIGALFGSVYGIAQVLQKKADRKSAFAFGPFLSLGIFVSALFGSRIIDFYLRLFGL